MGVLMNIEPDVSLSNLAYIGGSGNGILTVLGKPASKPIYLMDAGNMALISQTRSMSNGHWFFLKLTPDKEYIIIARDDKKEYEPFIWDYVKPATDLDFQGLKAMFASFDL